MSIPVSYTPVKRCKGCFEVLPISRKFFYRKKIKGKFYYNSLCIVCDNKRVTAWKKDRREKQR